MAPNPFAELASTKVLQVLGVYLVLEGKDGVIIDQHALHERVLYERLRVPRAASPCACSGCSTPEVLERTATDKDYLLEVAPALALEGLLVEDFGQHAVAVFGLPAVLARASARSVLETFLRAGRHRQPRPRVRAAIAERFHSMACRAAVMSGDPLAEGEVIALLEASAAGSSTRTIARMAGRLS